MTTAKNGLSAITLQRTLGTSYRTAWTMLHRYRIAMVRSEREPLSGTVEIDECLVGGVDHGGKRGRGADKAIVVIAVEIKDPIGYGNKKWAFNIQGFMQRRFASINDLPTKESECFFHWSRGQRPDDHASLSDLGL